MSNFIRALDGTKISNLLNDKLYTNCLVDDIIKNYKVFPAIRDENICFYHKGGRLFKYDGNDFETNIKYAAVILGKNSDYILRNDIEKTPIELKFITDYKRMKENCSQYANEEAQGVASIYHKHSYCNKDLKFVVLDIEVCFESQNEENKLDRIDLLLFNKENKKLKFIEVKHYSNKELWASTGKKPVVFDQIDRYKNQILSRKTEILTQYKEYIKIVNILFNCNSPSPDELDEDITLLIFGFDRDQQNGRLKELLIDDPACKGLLYYAKGDITQINLDTLWNKSKTIEI